LRARGKRLGDPHGWPHMPQAADAVNAPFEDSRRLTGANLYFDLPGAVLETAPGLGFDAATLQRWRGHVARARAALGWPDGPVVVREHATGASLRSEERRVGK